MNRIIILGPSGTGKTTLCRNLGKKLGLEILHLDSVYWQKDWQNLDKQTFDLRIRKFLTKHRKFIIDGNYSNNNHFKYRLEIADTIIFLDFGTEKALEGIHQRANEFKHQVRSDMADGCIEGIDQVFLKYVASYYKFRAKYLKAVIKQYENKKKVIVFKTREELYVWYNSL
ncbi:topology modulation protein [Candidatus Izimaplasma bacterium HR1]|jgi:adenylate kinase family enzyme|uniref:AAA family ATPase n=1 Tax=Candidatus Izimoplasma sp. HR1 TaxID=1541959 RepID=UPI0004F6AD40|nr:topology modulation protein [Candidatus Izimaplasma bacterium HR1]